MSSGGGDLFAGLSVSDGSPKKSPSKPPPEASSDSNEVAKDSVPEPPMSSPDVEATSSPVRQVSAGSAVSNDAAPVTDKLLNILGTPPSSPKPTPAAAASSPDKKKETNSPKKSDQSPRTPSGSKKKKSPPPKVVTEVDDEAILAAFSLDPPTPSSSPTKAKSLSSDTRGALKEMSEKKSIPKTPPARGAGVVHADTPIPNSDVALRVLRKFAAKTRPLVPSSHGGTQRLSIVRFILGASRDQEVKYTPYKELIELLMSGDDETPEPEADDDKIVNGIMGQSGDTMAKARKAIASFCHLLSGWGHASAHMAEVDRDSSGYKAFCSILATGLDTATSLVTHGCLDGVKIGIGTRKDEFHKAVDILAESVFASDLSMETNELAAMKFLLSTGCRVGMDGEAMLRGTHLLQTIRVLYHVYLTTPVKPNKTTARASLQQLVTSVFIRMIAASSDAPTNPSPKANEKENFPSEDHKDAFLVLRSLCKLSMRNAPHDPNMHSHIGLQASGSNMLWDSKEKESSERGGHDFVDQGPKDYASLIYTQAIHPALESKILALDLLLYVLQNTEMEGSFLSQCGPQFHYAVRNYLCVSLLKNCTSDDTRVVNLSLRVFVPIIHNFRSILKTEIEAFVTNVFFVILDSKNSPIEHKRLVVTLFEEICSDPTTLAEIFLNYDCDLSAVDLFHRIVNTLSRVSRSTEEDESVNSSTISLVAGTGAARMEKTRFQHRELRLEAMRAMRQILASLHASIVEPLPRSIHETHSKDGEESKRPEETSDSSNEKSAGKQTLVDVYDSKKKRRAEESEAILRFNQKPSAGIAYAGECGHVDGSDPQDVARYLLENKDVLEKTQIGEYLGREPEYQGGFSLKVLHAYVNQMDFAGLLFDDAIRFYLSGFRLPGEAQKIDRIMEKFAERFTAQNPDVFPTADVAFILAFSIIMLNTDLHNPAIKEERRMTKQGFIRNNRGIADGQDLPEELLTSIFDRIKSNPFSLKEDDEARERMTDPNANNSYVSLPSALNPSAFFTSHYDEVDRTKETNFNKERDQILRTTESLLRRRRHAVGADNGKSPRRRQSSGVGTSPRHHSHVRYVRTIDSGLRDEYVSPMFEVAWGPALAAFSTAMESGNGTVGALLTIASDAELEQAAENAAETIEVCLTGFRFAICTAGLCGNEVARDAFMHALSRFSQLGTGALLEPRNIRCIQTMLALARSDGELLGSSWEHVFKALSEINRYHQLFQLLARNDRVVANAAERRKAKMQERERRHEEREKKRAAREASDSLDDASEGSFSDASLDSFGESTLFEEDDLDFGEEMNKKEIDEANARTVYEAVSEGFIEAIYERSSSLSTSAVKDFILQLCRVSRIEISNFGGKGGSSKIDLDGFHHHQTNIYNLQKLVEVTHYNMESRPRLVFADLWTTVAGHLTNTALHTNPAVAMYAVDSFRQLSTQYLQRQELEVFEFQRRFLKPLETVMTQSELSTTKELLLKCVERIILMFGSSADGKSGGMLRSGWRPILTVLGLAGRDHDKSIAKLGFDMLTGQLEQCLAPNEGGKGKSTPRSVLLAERFVDLVDALLIYVDGEHEEMSLTSIDHLLTLSAYLGDESFSLPLIRRRASSVSGGDVEVKPNQKIDGNPEFELWWPILLGLSRSVGDSRRPVQNKSLEALLKIIRENFVSKDSNLDEGESGNLQTLQLIFRGILTPVLEFGEIIADDSRSPELPTEFDRFLTVPKEDERERETTSYWIDHMFDQFMDGCVGICVSSINVFGDDTLVEEIFAMLNTCLLSDSGVLAVRGLRRLEQFITSDLSHDVITDDTWATVSHMLRRCLTIRGLPKPLKKNEPTEQKEDAEQGTPEESAEEKNALLEHKEAIREFLVEDNLLSDRRFIGSNVAMMIGTFFSSESFAKSLGIRWRIFLATGLAKSIQEWEYASLIFEENSEKKRTTSHNP